MGSQAWVESIASRIIVGRKTVVPAGALPGTGTGAGVEQDGVTYGLHVSRRVLDPLQDGAPAALADKT